MYVIKRDGRKVEFDKQKIIDAISKAMKFGEGLDIPIATKIANEINNVFLFSGTDMSISTIEKIVYEKLITYNHKNTARLYEGYRAVREYQRHRRDVDDQVLNVVKDKDNSNKNPRLISTMRDLTAEVISKDMSLRMLLPPDIAQAHNEGIIYIHDLGHYLNPSINCCLCNLEDMLQNGTVINGKLIEKPHSFRTACTIATQIIAQVASGQFGGQTITLTHLAPFVRISYNNIRKEVENEISSLLDKNDPRYENIIEEIASKRLKKEIKDGIQTFQYQINTLQSSNGQAPFLSVFMYISENPEYEKETAMLIEEMLNQRILGMKNKVGAYVSPAFPKLLYALDENNIHEDSKYWYLTKLAAKCVVNRMMPDFLSVKVLKEHYEGVVTPPMGCRAFLSPYNGKVNNEEGKYKIYGRFNCGLTSINLPDAGLSAKGNIDEFWKILDERLELCHKSLKLRFEKLTKATADTSPIHWQFGALARLGDGEPIEPLLRDGYATISLGYTGVFECVLALIGKSHTTPEGEKLAVEIVQYMKDAVMRWKSEENIGYAVYGTPSESLTERFAKLTRKRWGVVKGITDKNYIVNSFHVDIKEHINAFDKIKFESQFHAISSGGCISYIEMPNMKNNEEAVLEVIKYIYDTTQYCEFNTKLDYCQACGFEGEIICDDNLQWVCPECGNRDTNKMNIVRRTCGLMNTSPR